MANLIDNKTLEKKAIDEIIIDEDIIEKRKYLNKWINMYEKGTLESSKEIEIQGEFLEHIFSNVLGAVNKTDGLDNWNLQREMLTIDGEKADGVLGYFTKDSNDVRAVIELKGPNIDLDERLRNTNNKRSAVKQAFDYVSGYGKNVSWVIVSNYKEIRLYKSNNREEYQCFYLKDLKDDIEFKKFIYLLSFDSLIKREDNKSNTEKLAEDYQIEQKRIEKQFYNEYKEIRLKIYENIKKNNKEIRNEIIVEKVQKLLDRFLFIAFCEDKELLPKNIYHITVEKGDKIKDIYQSFKNLCSWVDKGSTKYGINKYNGGLFKSDDILDDLIIDDEVFKELEKISNYDFASTLNEEILGHVFEKSISDIEELKNKKEDKRKKDGIFYTPKYITRYIVRKTIDNWIEDRKRELGGEDKLPELKEKNNKKADIKKHIEFYKGLRDRIRKIKIIDPACGSGAFLLTAFEYLYEINKNIEEILSKIEPTINIFDELEKDILQNNIYGVDLNNESVEITKLSLWLKTADVKKTLVSLDRNIKSGNSLIEDETIDIKAFKWQEEFKEVFEDGGFDIVIGNPPYGVSFDDKTKKYLTNFDFLVPDYEIYIYFISLYKKILKNNGYLSYIFPNTFLITIYGKEYRKFLFNDVTIKEIVDLSNDRTFEDANVRTIIFTINKKNNISNEKTRFSKIETNSKEIKIFKEYSLSELQKNISNILNLFYQNDKEKKIIESIQNNYKLSDFFEVSQGLIPYDKYRGHSEEMIKNRVYHSNKQENSTYKKELKGADVTSYYFEWNGILWINYGDWLAAPRDSKFFNEERILIREITNKRLLATYLNEEYYNTPSLINIISEKKILDLKYLLSILNSTLMGWYHNKTSSKANKGLFPKILINDVRKLPIKYLDEISQKPFIEKVDIMLELHKNFNDLKNKFIRNIQREFNLDKLSKKLNEWYLLEYKDFLKEIEKNKIKITLDSKEEWEIYFFKRKEEILKINIEIKKIDKEIDEMVYKLYNLSEEEIKIIENNF